MNNTQQQVNLENRVAHCQCGATQASSTSLAFFEYLGEGSEYTTITCVTCGYSPIAHERAVELNEPHLAHCRGHEFTPAAGREIDRFYCGCRGWD